LLGFVAILLDRLKLTEHVFCFPNGSDEEFCGIIEIACDARNSEKAHTDSADTRKYSPDIMSESFRVLREKAQCNEGEAQAEADKEPLHKDIAPIVKDFQSLSSAALLGISRGRFGLFRSQFVISICHFKHLLKRMADIGIMTCLRYSVKMTEVARCAKIKKKRRCDGGN